MRAQANNYPFHVGERNSADKFLTSRLRNTIDPSVDIEELCPILSRSAPCQVVPEIVVSIETEGMDIEMIVAASVYHIANFSP